MFVRISQIHIFSFMFVHFNKSSVSNFPSKIFKKCELSRNVCTILCSYLLQLCRRLKNRSKGGNQEALQTVPVWHLCKTGLQGAEAPQTHETWKCEHKKVQTNVFIDTCLIWNVDLMSFPPDAGDWPVRCVYSWPLSGQISWFVSTFSATLTEAWRY